jgi:hypothetical protein
MKEKRIYHDIRSYEKCSENRKKQIGRLLHPPILKNQSYIISLFDIGADNGCHLHHIDGLAFL